MASFIWGARTRIWKVYMYNGRIVVGYCWTIRNGSIVYINIECNAPDAWHLLRFCSVFSFVCILFACSCVCSPDDLNMIYFTNFLEKILTKNCLDFQIQNCFAWTLVKWQLFWIEMGLIVSTAVCLCPVRRMLILSLHKKCHCLTIEWIHGIHQQFMHINFPRFK